MQGSDWDVEAAIDAFFQEGGASVSAPTVSPTQTRELEQTFCRYRDSEQLGMILADGISQLCCDLQVCACLPLLHAAPAAVFSSSAEATLESLPPASNPALAC